MSALVGEYIDWISQFIFDVYERERERWVSAEGNVRATLVHDLLGLGARPREFEAGTGYRLAGRHLALVVWATSTDSSPEEQRLLNRVIARVASGLDALTLHWSAQSMWPPPGHGSRSRREEENLTVPGWRTR
ncbi:hypothetical protein ACWZJV_27120 [Nocardioides sp. WG-D5]